MSKPGIPQGSGFFAQTSNPMSQPNLFSSGVSMFKPVSASNSAFAEGAKSKNLFSAPVGNIGSGANLSDSFKDKSPDKFSPHNTATDKQAPAFATPFSANLNPIKQNLFSQPVPKMENEFKIGQAKMGIPMEPNNLFLPVKSFSFGAENKDLVMKNERTAISGGVPGRVVKTRTPRTEAILEKLQEDIRIIRESQENREFSRHEKVYQGIRFRINSLQENLPGMLLGINTEYAKSMELRKTFERFKENNTMIKFSGPFNILIAQSTDKLMEMSKRIEEIVYKDLEEQIYSLKTIKDYSHVTLDKEKTSRDMFNQRIAYIRRSIVLIEKEVFAMNHRMRKERAPIYSLWDDNKYQFDDPEDMKSIFNSIFIAKKMKSDLSSPQKPENFTESALLEKTNLKITLNLPSSMTYAPQPRNAKRSSNESFLLKISKLKEDLFLKIQREKSETSEVNPEPKLQEIQKSAQEFPAIPQEAPKNPQGFPRVSQEPSPFPTTSIQFPSENKFRTEEAVKSQGFQTGFPASNLRPQELNQSNPFSGSGSGFGQPTSFAAPSHLPNMSGLTNKTFGVESNPFQTFGGFSGPQGSVNPTPPPQNAPPQNAPPPNTTSSFFKLRK